MKIYIFYSHSG